MKSLLTLYVIKSQDGDFFKSRGRHENWVNDLKKAKIYSKLGSARSEITYWANNYSEFGIPMLVELHITEIVEVDEQKRVTASIKKILNKKKQYEKDLQRRHLEQAQKDLKKAQEKIDKLSK